MIELTDYQRGYLKGLHEASRAFEALYSADQEIDRLSYCLGWFDGSEALEKELKQTGGGDE